MPDERSWTEVEKERHRAIEIIDAQDRSGPVPLLDGDEAMAVLATARRICIVGASADPGRASHGVMRYMIQQGFDCVPVNPKVREVLGVPAWRTIEEAVAETGPFDIIDVFRRSEHTPGHARSAVEVGALVLWLQLGVVNWQAAQIAHDGGLSVVMDRCTAMDHRRLRDRRRPAR
jgi:predicted CoA-binding protein